MMHRRHLKRAGYLAVLALAATALAGFTLHLRLTKSFPAKDQVVTAAPDSLQLWFSQKTDIKLTRAILVGPDSQRVAVSKAVRAPDDEKSVIIRVEGELVPENYTIMWQAGSPDGHIVKGEFGFSYDPNAADPGSGRR